jgi:asparagine synthase (glutamine-hydrolysing)
MCGICGFVKFEDAAGTPGRGGLYGGRGDGALSSARHEDLATLRKMVNALKHRGPDSIGLYHGGSDAVAFLGHARLKVIDLTDSASQPLSNEDGLVRVVFNGEIYNYRELRDWLKARGHAFRSESDTEVIVHAYEEEGPEFIVRLDGMFAFALWDARSGRVMLGRDRTGKKPLFYHIGAGRCTFASEIKAVIVCPWVGRAVSAGHIPEYLYYGYVPQPNTLYEGILQVPAATYLTMDASGIRGPKRYWRLSVAAGAPSPPFDEARERVRRLLIDAVSKRLVSDVPLGVLLSGGIDSSIIVAIIAKVLKRDVRTFSIGFAEDPSFDERPAARLVARHFGSVHTEFAVEMDAVGLMERLLWHHDQPYGDAAALPTYLVCRATREHVTVALNGDGGDEVFAGYDRFRAALISERMPRILSAAGRGAAAWLPRTYGYYSLKRRMERFFGEGATDTSGRYIGWTSIISDDLLREVLRDGHAFTWSKKSPRAFAESLLAESEGVHLLNRLLHLNFMSYLPEGLNVKMDRMSMANSLETRSPFLDTGLMEYAAMLPPWMKINRGRAKYILREAFKDLLPPAILKRRKHGFGMPLGAWFRGTLGAMFVDIALTGRPRSWDYLRSDVLRRMYEEHQSERFDHGARLWSILQFELWLRMNERPLDPIEGLGPATRLTLVQGGI